MYARELEEARGRQQDGREVVRVTGPDPFEALLSPVAFCTPRFGVHTKRKS